MSKTAALLSALAMPLAFGLAATPASALNTRSFVSANGLDTNSCARTAPCRTLQTAFNNTTAGGEINVLDPAGYGTLTITHAISIVNDGVGSAGVLVPPSSDGITITAGDSDAINLRGLTIEGAGAGVSGITFNNGRSLTIENCVIRNLLGTAINFIPSAPNVFTVLSVSNTLIADNFSNGINVRPNGSVLVTAVVNRVTVHNNGETGITVDGGVSTGTINVVVSESVVSNNDFGLSVASSGGHAATALMLARSVVARNNTGLFTVGAKLRLAQSAVTGNATAWSTHVGELPSYGDNYIDGNTSDGAVALAAASKR